VKEIEIKSVLQVYDSFDELPEDIQGLMQQSIAIRDKAYAPYSEF
jgi:cytidine deaminase